MRVVLMILGLALASAPAWALGPGPTTKLSDGQRDSLAPGISSWVPLISGTNIVVWTGDKGDDGYDVLWDHGGVATDFTPSSGNQWLPAIDGKWVAWLDDNSPLGVACLLGDLENPQLPPLLIGFPPCAGAAVYSPNSYDQVQYVYETAGELVFTPDLVNFVKPAASFGLPARHPRIHGDWIVWEGMTQATGNSGIFAYRISTQQGYQITGTLGDDHYPDVWNGRVVFVRNGATIVCLGLPDNPACEAEVLSTPLAQPGPPRISNGNVVWADHRGGDWDVYGGSFTPAGFTEVALATGANDQFMPDLQGMVMVYADGAAGGIHDVYRMDLQQ